LWYNQHHSEKVWNLWRWVHVPTTDARSQAAAASTAQGPPLEGAAGRDQRPARAGAADRQNQKDQPHCSRARKIGQTGGRRIPRPADSAVTTLYVVGVAADAPEDMSPRARRILQEVALILTDEGEAAGRLLEQQAISTPLLALTDAQSTADLLPAGDAALLFCHGAPGPSERGRALVRAALQAGMAVVPIPGPALAITALVVSGLPAQSFVYLDQLPPDPAARQQLVASFAAERRPARCLGRSAFGPGGPGGGDGGCGLARPIGRSSVRAACFRVLPTAGPGHRRCRDPGDPLAGGTVAGRDPAAADWQPNRAGLAAPSIAW